MSVKLRKVGDLEQGLQTLRSLHTLGYAPQLNKGFKGAVESIAGQQSQWYSGAPIIPLALFEQGLMDGNYGVSICVTRFQDETFAPFDVDVDIYDHSALEMVASLLPPGAPAWRGPHKAGHLMFKRRHDFDFKDRLSRIESLTKPGVKVRGHRLRVAWHAAHEEAFDRPAMIDLMSAFNNQHALVPPTLYADPSKPDQDAKPQFYEWVPGRPRLTEVAPKDLPEIRIHHVLILYMWAKAGEDSPMVRFIRESGPGNFKDHMRDASYYLAQEGWDQDEVVALCEEVVERYEDSDDRPKHNERLKMIRTDVAGAFQKIESSDGPKPAKNAKGGKDKTPKVPPERRMAEWLLERYDPSDLAAINGLAYHWKGDKWADLTDPRHFNEPWAALQLELLAEFPTAPINAVRNALAIFKVNIPTVDARSSPTEIPFKDCILDVRTGKTREERKEDYLIGRLQHYFDPDAHADRWREAVRRLCRPPEDYEQRESFEKDWNKACRIFEEFLGYCLANSHAFEKLLFLEGPPGTGKSQMLKAIQALLPSEWVSTVPMEMFDEPNQMAQMVRSRVNICGEVGRSSREVDQRLLSITSGEAVPVKVLYKDVVNIPVPSRLIAHGNKPFATADATGAIARRTLIIKTTDKVVGPDEKIYNFWETLMDEAPGILHRLARAYHRLLERGHFEETSYHQEEVEGQRTQANSAASWLNHSGTVEPSDKGGAANDDLYRVYARWCKTFYPRAIQNLSQWGASLGSMGYRTTSVRLGTNVVSGRKLKLTLKGQQFLDDSIRGVGEY